MRPLLLFAALVLFATAASAAPPTYSYDASKPVAATFGAARTPARGVTARDFRFRSTTGNIVTGEIVTGKAGGRHPGILWVHWLGEKNANHHEFEPDAYALAKRGVTSVLVDAMWSKHGWFRTVGKSAEDDYRVTVNQVIDLRRALDLLLAQPGVDPNRIAFVGHDFGGMAGALMAAVDRRPQHWVFMAVTPKFSDWYLLGKQHPDRAAYVKRLEELDTLASVERAHARGYLFQFSGPDKFVSAANARAFFESAPEPRGVYYYDAEHDLDVPAAHDDRLNWLSDQLALH